MNPTTPSVPATPRRRRIWPWVLVICLAPWALIAVAVASYLSLDSDAAVLRRQVMSATHTSWDTKVQCSVGRLTIGAVRTGLVFVPKAEIADARLALAAVKHASVGVYERKPGNVEWSRQQLLVETDRVMQKRGWTRLAGITERDQQAVLIYMPEDFDDGDEVDLCVAVVNDRELVVVSTTIAPDALTELVAKHAPEDFKQLAKRHRAKV